MSGRNCLQSSTQTLMLHSRPCHTNRQQMLCSETVQRWNRVADHDREYYLLASKKGGTFAEEQRATIDICLAKPTARGWAGTFWTVPP